MNELVGRIRWGNIGRIAAVLAAVGLVVAWPKLKSRPPEIPPAATIPAQRPADPVAPTVTTTAAASTQTRPSAAEPEPEPEQTRPRRHKRKRKRKRRPQPPAVVTPTPTPRPVVPAAPPTPQAKPEFQPFG
jgi:hypothetical protein